MPDAQSVEQLRHQTAESFGLAPREVRVVFAPYRICPLGAHIDHQLGLVTAMALNDGVCLAYAPSRTPEVRLRSLAFPGEVRFRLGDVPEKRDGDWGNYARGAVRALQQTHRLESGLVGITTGSVSEGGLSSSAAVGVAYLLALEDVNGLKLPPEVNIVLDQFIENRYLGLRNGILDQAAILLSRRGYLTLIDCATVRHEQIPTAESMPPFVILAAESGLQKALVGTDYNRRVAECTEAAKALLAAAGHAAEAPVLGYVRAEEYTAHKHRLSGPAARRAAHFFSEMDRVERGTNAWHRGDLAEFGRLITASGDSSIHNYECGAPPLVDLYRILAEAEGVYGTRFSGAGFRGCCIALADPDAAPEIAARVEHTYHIRYPDLASRARVLLFEPDDGARIVT